MTKEKTARLIPNAIQVCTDTEKVPSRLFAPTAAQLDDRFFKSTLQSILFLFVFFTFSALFHLVWRPGPHLHDDVPTVAERAAGQG